MSLGLALLVVVDAARPQPPGFPKFKEGFGPKRSGPKVDTVAPDFELKLLDSEKKFKLSDNFGKKPTVLIFHSFT